MLCLCKAAARTRRYETCEVPVAISFCASKRGYSPFSTTGDLWRDSCMPAEECRETYLDALSTASRDSLSLHKCAFSAPPAKRSYVLDLVASQFKQERS